MERSDLFDGSFLGAFFFTRGTTTTGGRKSSIKQIINSDRQLVQDLGGLQDSFTINGFIGRRVASDGTVVRTYQEVRSQLLQALKSGRRGKLVHPFFGEIDNVRALTWSLSESHSRLGLSPISMSFAIDNTDGLPKPVPATERSVANARQTADAQTSISIEEDFSVLEFANESFAPAVDKVNDIVDLLRFASDFTQNVTEEIDEFNRQLNSISENVATLVNSPQALADALTNSSAAISNLFATPVAVFEAYQRMFDFGDLDTQILPTTGGRIVRKLNQDTLNNAMQSFSLSGAYAAVAQIDFFSVDQINEAQLVLEDQYQKMISTGTLDSDVETELTSERVIVSDFFQSERDVKPRIEEIRVEAVPARVLSYRLYGTSEFGDILADLNGVKDASFLEGVVKVLSV